MSLWSRLCHRKAQADPAVADSELSGPVRAPQPPPNTFTDAERAAGVRSLSDRDYRKERIDLYIEAMADPSPEKVSALASFLDLWDIAETSSGYLASPRWDDEPMLARNAHPTREEAEAYVANLGGKLGSA